MICSLTISQVIRKSLNIGGNLMRITVSGLPGSGTTTLARHLSEVHGYRMISAGEVFRQMARERGVDLSDFGRMAEMDPAIDREIDFRQREIAEGEDDIVAEGRLSGWFVRNADLRIWLQAPLSCRVERISRAIPSGTGSLPSS